MQAVVVSNIVEEERFIVRPLQNFQAAYFNVVAFFFFFYRRYVYHIELVLISVFRALGRGDLQKRFSREMVY